MVVKKEYLIKAYTTPLSKRVEMIHFTSSAQYDEIKQMIDAELFYEFVCPASIFEAIEM